MKRDGTWRDSGEGEVVGNGKRAPLVTAWYSISCWRNDMKAIWHRGSNVAPIGEQIGMLSSRCPRSIIA